jgi:hypothetical protein
VPGMRRRCLSAPAPPVDLLRLPAVVVHGDGDGAVAPMLASSMPPPWPPLLPAVAAPASSSARGGSTSHHSRIGPAAASARRRLARMARHRLRPPPRRSARRRLARMSCRRLGLPPRQTAAASSRDAAPAPGLRRLTPRRLLAPGHRRPLASVVARSPASPPISGVAATAALASVERRHRERIGEEKRRGLGMAAAESREEEA